MTSNGTKSKLGELLLSSGAIDRHQLEAALGYQRRWGGRLGEIVIDMQFAGDDRICGALARQLGVPAVDLASREIPTEVVRAIPPAVCEKYRLFPFEIVKQERGPARLWVAMADPTNLEAIDEIRFRTGMTVSVAAAPSSAVDTAIRRYIHGERISSAEPDYRAAFVPPTLSEPAAQDGPVLELANLFDDEPGFVLEPERKPAPGRGLMEQLEALADGRAGGPPVPAWKMVGVLVHLLAEKGIVSDADFLDALAQD